MSVSERTHSLSIYVCVSPEIEIDMRREIWRVDFADPSWVDQEGRMDHHHL